MVLRVFSFGGGVQSTAALVLAVQRKIDYRVFLFANVGEDSENPHTLDYISEYAGPYAQRHGIELIELRKERRDKQPETVHSRLTKPGSRSIGIPVRMSSGAPARRACTLDFKIRVVAKWLKAHGATEQSKAVVGIGFSTDEVERAGSAFDERIPWQIKEYPLLRPLYLSRNDCINLVLQAGLPQPPKSACWFCPYHSPLEWQRMHREEPEQFAKACDLEDFVNARRARLGKDHVYFTRFMKPLRELFAAGTQLTMDELMWRHGCDSGYCWR